MCIAGRLIPLAVSSAQRLAERPDLPTLSELGYPDMVTTTWHMLAGPAGLPREIVSALNREVAQIVERPEMRKHLRDDAVETRVMTPGRADAVRRGRDREVGRRWCRRRWRRSKAVGWAKARLRAVPTTANSMQSVGTGASRPLPTLQALHLGHAGVQHRAAAAADFLEAAVERARHLGRVGELLAIGAERLADLGEVDIGGELGRELVLRAWRRRRDRPAASIPSPPTSRRCRARW